MEKTIIDMLALVKAGKVTVVRSPEGWIRSINCNRPGLEVQDIRYTKNVCGGVAVGSTPEDLAEDEKAIRQFMSDWSGTDVLKLASLAEMLNKPELTDKDIYTLNAELARLIDRNKEVQRVEVPVKVSDSKYPELYEQLEILDIETLKAIRNKARRENATDLMNACRTTLRHKGVNC